MGLVVLMGGNEFRPNCLEMDKALLAATGLDHPRVAILPTAATPENPTLAAQNGVAYFQRLGAMAVPSLILTRNDAENPALLEPILAADLIYLTGGNPGYLLQTLKDTPGWEAIVARYRAGKMVIGSSAGAMALAAKMRQAAGWVEALALVPGVAVRPHGESLSQAQVSSLPPAASEEMTLLTIDTATGCVWLGAGGWQVLGQGQVRVHRAGQTIVYQAGEQFFLP